MARPDFSKALEERVAIFHGNTKYSGWTDAYIAQAREEHLLGLLERLEWAKEEMSPAGTTFPMCPVCLAWQGDAHESDCDLGQVLAEWRGRKGEATL